MTLPIKRLIELTAKLYKFFHLASYLNGQPRNAAFHHHSRLQRKSDSRQHNQTDKNGSAKKQSGT
jgi:hypothetical protein